MNKTEAEKRTITIHWWNMGSKTLEFNGSVKDYLIKRQIKVRKISHKFNKTVKGYRFKIPLATSTVIFDTFYQEYVMCVTEAIKIFLTLLGDKTVFINPYGREYKINWR